MTKAIIIKKQGGPEVLELSDIKLGAPGPNEIKVKNIAIGLNYIDTYHRSGLYPVNLPSGIGLEAAGKIIEIGSGVKDLNVGDNVAYAGGVPSAYAEERILSAQLGVKIPDGISHKVAACIMTKGLTTHYLLCKTYKLTSKDIVLFHAAAGGVGQLFCQWARAIGCKIIGTVGSDEKIQIAKDNGCDHVINYTTDDFSKKVLKNLNKQLIDLEKSFISEKGMYFGSWFKSIYAASDPFSGYAAWILPGLEYEIALNSSERLQEWDSRYASAVNSLHLKMKQLILDLK
mgnify:CR=1 FL=1